MLILNLIESKFEKLNHIKRILLYVFPLVLLTSWIMSLPQTQTNIKEEKKIHTIQKKIKQLNKKISSTPDIFRLITDIEKFSKKNNIVIKSIKHEQGLYHIEFHSKRQSIHALISFCDYLSAFSKINYLKVFINKEEADVSMKLSFSNYYAKKTKPLQYKSIKKEKVLFELKAIIDHYVLINDQWLTLNDTITHYKVSAISMNKVELTNQDKKLILELFDETK